MMDSTKELNLDDILVIQDTKVVKVEIPDWKGHVYIKQLSAFEQDKFEADSRGPNGGPNLQHMRARLVAAALCDKDGNKLIKDGDAKSTIAKLSLKSGAVLNYLIDRITEINRITTEDLEKIAKN